MIIKYAIALAVLLLFAVAFRWAFLPARYLPGNRVRHLRTRLHLRLHPGKGFATIVQPVAALGPARRAAPLGADPPVAAAVVPDAGAGAVLGVRWAGRTGGTGCGSRWKSTCW